MSMEKETSSKLISKSGFPSDFSSMKLSEKKSLASKIPHLKTLLECSASLPPLVSNDNHTVLFKPCVEEGYAPKPYPEEYYDKWDDDHVQMPCSPHNLYSVDPSNVSIKHACSRWSLICESLSHKIESSDDLENAIKKYNSEYAKEWKFAGLHIFLNEKLNDLQKKTFFGTTLPGIIKLALQLPQICTQPIPLLKNSVDHAITLSQKQIGCLLANAFLCTFPIKKNMRKCLGGLRIKSSAIEYQYINFNGLFDGSRTLFNELCAEKLKCLLNYFQRIITKEPTGTVTFHRKCYKEFPNWETSDAKLEKAVINSDEGIEEVGDGMLQVDFADKFIGGIVLERGGLQEEVMFITCPELIVSMLFTEKLLDQEALLITGVERYNNHLGYNKTFQWKGNYDDEKPRDAWGRKYAQVVAIDATPFRKLDDQFQLSALLREVNKAYVGFSEKDNSENNLCTVATGNWGCGAFRGLPTLKFLIQLMAVSQARRSILYCTFHDKELQEKLENMHKFLTEKNFTVGQLWTVLSNYCKYIQQSQQQSNRTEFYEYIYNSIK